MDAEGRDWSRAGGTTGDGSPRHPRLARHQLRSLQEQGFLLVERALTPSALDRLRLVVREHLAPDGAAPGLLPAGRFGEAGAMFSWDPAFVDLIDHRWTAAVLGPTLGPSVRLDHAFGLVRRPGEAGSDGPPGLDQLSYQCSGVPAAWAGELLGFCWALSDGRAGDGGFACVPGSHRRRTAGDPLRAVLTEVTQPAGSLLVFNEALSHAELPWRGATERVVLLLKYSTAGVPVGRSQMRGQAQLPEV